MQDAQAQACTSLLVDAPDCACFHDDRTWSPSGDLLTVAEKTAEVTYMGTTLADGVHESCITSGGQPFWMFQWGFTSSAEAINRGVQNEIYWAAKPREHWCSETVSFWHRQAELPYDNGYSNGPATSWRFRGSKGIKNWYVAEEEASLADPTYDALGSWIDDTEMSFTTPTPGVDLPCPGAYQRLVSWDANDLVWKGRHSQLVHHMEITQDTAGTVCEVKIWTIDGNISDTTLIPTHVWTLPDDLQHKGDAVHGVRVIDGWGIDWEDDGSSLQPSCDTSSISYVTLPPLSSCTATTITASESRPMDWLPFWEAVIDLGIDYRVDSYAGWDERLPEIVVGNPWLLPGAAFTDGVAILEVEWPEEIPYPVQELEFELSDASLTNLTVQALDKEGTVLATATSHTSLAEPRVWATLGTAVSPTTLRFVLSRSSTTDLQLLELWVHPEDEGDVE